MKLTIGLLLVGLMQVSATVYSQATKFSFKTENKQIVDVLKGIEDESNFRFFYIREQVDVERKVSVKANNATLEEILDELFADQGIGYKVMDDNLVLLSPDSKIANMVSVSGQQKAISGTVTDESDQPMPGVTVTIKGTTRGTVTNSDGKYTIPNIPENAVLLFSFVGMRTQEVVVGNQVSVNARLEFDAIGIEEVVAVGYGVQKKVNMTGAVASVNMEEVLNNRPVISIASALQGAVPGLKIETASAEPGQSPTYNIRGITSINGGGPLVLVDNVPMDMSTLNPDDIESISVLKDAASTAIYGARAAFGVILITTKRVKENSAFTLNYNNNISFQTPVTLPEYATLEQALQLYEDAAAGSGLTNSDYWTGQNIGKWKNYLADYRINPGNYPDGRAAEGAIYYLKESNPIKRMMETGFQQQQNVSASGGTEKLTYRLSFGYANQNGVLISDKDSYKRITTSAYTSAKITTWLKQEIDIKYTKSERSNPDGNQYGWAMTDGVWCPEGFITHADGIEYPVRNANSTIFYESPARTYIETPRIFAKTTLTPIKNLEIVGEYTYNKEAYNYYNYENTFYMYDVTEAGPEIANGQDWYYNNTYLEDRNTVNIYGTYIYSIKDLHNFSLMGGFNQDRYNRSNLNVSVLGQIVPTLPSISQSTGIPIAEDIFNEYATRGVFYRFNYNYKGKYLFEANGRYDGSSRFPKDRRFAFFPSVSAGYRISEEGFLDGADWLNNLKFRGSWGKIGNQNVSNYGYLPTMDSGLINWLVDGIKPTGTLPPGLVSSNYSWETVYTTNFGIDLGLLDGRFQATADIYQRDTKGMLTAGKTLPEVLGPPSPRENAADLTTKGWELSLEWNDKIGKVGYNIGVNLYDSQTEITRFANESGLLSDYYQGMIIGEMWGYTTERYYTPDDIIPAANLLAGGGQLIEGLPKPQGMVNFWPGDIKYADINNDGAITAGTSTTVDPGDRSIIGNFSPRYHFGTNLGANWKGFSASVFFQGIGKRDLWLITNYSSGVTTFNHNSEEILWPGLSFQPAVFTSVLDYWTPENTEAYYPRMYNEGGLNTGYNRRVQSKYLQNGAYIRLKNVSLAYTFPKSICQKIKVSNLKVFFSGENMLVWDYLPKGLDPELHDFEYPFYRTMSFGLNVTL